MNIYTKLDCKRIQAMFKTFKETALVSVTQYCISSLFCCLHYSTEETDKQIKYHI